MCSEPALIGAEHGLQAAPGDAATSNSSTIL